MRRSEVTNHGMESLRRTMSEKKIAVPEQKQTHRPTMRTGIQRLSTFRACRRTRTQKTNEVQENKLIDELQMNGCNGKKLFTVSEHELKVGDLLGRGRFCSIHGACVSSENVASKESKEQGEWRNQETKVNYDCFAIKILDKDAITDDFDLLKRHGDLVHEAQFLSSIQHPNIINMIGKCSSDSVISDYSLGFFIALERLFDTLEDKLRLWQSFSKIRVRKFSFVSKKVSLYAQRLWIARDVASALSYLHAHNIIHRDIKPENIGFDMQGNVKLFDFGLARELNPNSQIGQDLYDLSAMIGTPLYMAPEIMKGVPYGPSADIYSFAILIWQICSLQTPFEGYDCNLLEKLVVYKGERPKLIPSWPDNLKKLMQDSWSDNLYRRPSPDTISMELKEIVRGDLDRSPTNKLIAQSA